MIIKTNILWEIGILILSVFGCSKDNSDDPITPREVLTVSDTVIYLSADAGEKSIFSHHGSCVADYRDKRLVQCQA